MKPIRSVPRKRVLFAEYEVADTPWKKTKGIMFRNTLEKPVLFVLEKESRARAAIHSFFCLMPFDAIFLNSRREVVDVIENIRPWRPYIAPKRPAKFFVECEAGTAEKLGIRMGEVFEW